MSSRRKQPVDVAISKNGCSAGADCPCRPHPGLQVHDSKPQNNLAQHNWRSTAKHLPLQLAGVLASPSQARTHACPFWPSVPGQKCHGKPCSMSRVTQQTTRLYGLQLARPHAQAPACVPSHADPAASLWCRWILQMLPQPRCCAWRWPLLFANHQGWPLLADC